MWLFVFVHTCASIIFVCVYMCEVTLNFVSIAGSMRKIKGRQRESTACLLSLCKTTHIKILTKKLLILFTCSVQLIIHIM